MCTNLYVIDPKSTVLHLAKKRINQRQFGSYALLKGNVLFYSNLNGEAKQIRIRAKPNCLISGNMVIASFYCIICVAKLALSLYPIFRFASMYYHNKSRRKNLFNQYILLLHRSIIFEKGHISRIKHDFSLAKTEINSYLGSLIRFLKSISYEIGQKKSVSRFLINEILRYGTEI